MWHRKLSFIFLCHCFIVQVSKLHTKKLLATLLDRQEVLNIPKMVQFRNFSNPTQNDWGNFVRKKNVTTNEFPCLVENWFFFLPIELNVNFLMCLIHFNFKFSIPMSYDNNCFFGSTAKRNHCVYCLQNHPKI